MPFSLAELRLLPPLLLALEDDEEEADVDDEAEAAFSLTFFCFALDSGFEFVRGLCTFSDIPTMRKKCYHETVEIQKYMFCRN